MAVCVRPDTGGDMASVLALARQLGAPGQTAQMLAPESCAGLLADDRADLFVGDDGGLVVGYVLTHYRHVVRSDVPVALLDELVVHEPFRGQGVGRLLVRTAIMRAWDAGCGEVVLASAGAGSFYERLGFRRTADYYKLPRPS